MNAANTTQGYDEGFDAGMAQGQRDYMSGEWNPALYRCNRRSDDYQQGFSAGYHQAGEE